MASFVAVLAEKTSFTEHQILWELPLSRAFRYYHAYLWQNGAWTVKRGPSIAAQEEVYAEILKTLETGEDDE